MNLMRLVNEKKMCRIQGDDLAVCDIGRLKAILSKRINFMRKHRVVMSSAF